MAQVAIPFQTVTQIFLVNMEVYSDDDLEPFDFNDFLSRGFLIPDPVDPAPPPIP